MSVKTMKMTAEMLAERDKRIAELGDVLIGEQDENARLVERIAELEAERDLWMRRAERLYWYQSGSTLNTLKQHDKWFDDNGKPLGVDDED